MKTHKLNIILFCFGAVFSSSCSHFLYTSLDVLRPAKVSFELNANNLLIINNTVPQPSNLGHLTQLLNENPKYVSFNTDSLAIFCLSALYEDIETKDFFSSYQYNPKSINTSSDFLSTNVISENSIKNLCREKQSNVILSLDKIKVNDELNEYFIPDNSNYVATLELRYETTWSIHYPANSTAKSITFKDTLYWESESYSKSEALKSLPKREDALVDGALEVGHKTVNRVIPYWEKVDRYFYNSKILKRGMDSVFVKNWTSAIEIWELTYNTSSDLWVKFQAANNIAICYEISGNIEKALAYATYAYYSYGMIAYPIDNKSFNRISDYIIELNQRKNEIEILKKQVGE